MIVGEKIQQKKCFAIISRKRPLLCVRNARQKTEIPQRVLHFALVDFCCRHLVCYHYEFAIPYMYNVISLNKPSKEHQINTNYFEEGQFEAAR